MIATFSSSIVHTEEVISSVNVSRKCLSKSNSERMMTLTGRVRTCGREVQGLHPDNACNDDTWEFLVSLELAPSAAAVAPRYRGHTKSQGQI